MKTAEEIIEKHYNMDKDEDRNKILYPWSVKNAMIEFAKMHVEAALKAASNVSFPDSKYDVENAYPLENIK